MLNVYDLWISTRWNVLLSDLLSITRSWHIWILAGCCLVDWLNKLSTSTGFDFLKKLVETKSLKLGSVALFSSLLNLLPKKQSISCRHLKVISWMYDIPKLSSEYLLDGCASWVLRNFSELSRATSKRRTLTTFEFFRWRHLVRCLGRLGLRGRFVFLLYQSADNRLRRLCAGPDYLPSSRSLSQRLPNGSGHELGRHQRPRPERHKWSTLQLPSGHQIDSVCCLPVTRNGFVGHVCQPDAGGSHHED